jgi:hypothetical protein
MHRLLAEERGCVCAEIVVANPEQFSDARSRLGLVERGDEDAGARRDRTYGRSRLRAASWNAGRFSAKVDAPASMRSFSSISGAS